MKARDVNVITGLVPVIPIGCRAAPFRSGMAETGPAMTREIAERTVPAARVQPSRLIELIGP